MKNAILEAIDKLIGPPTPPDVALARIVIQQSGVELANEAEIEQLRELQEQGERAHDNMMGHVGEKRLLAWREHLKAIQSQSSSPGGFRVSTAPSQHEWMTEGRKLADLAKIEQWRLESETGKIARTIYTRLNQAASTLADGIEKDERKAFTRFSLPYSPSMLVQSLRAVGMNPKSGLPREALPFLVI